MKPGSKLFIAAVLPIVFSACGTMAPPKPPSLDLPNPPKDLRAVRKGDQVILTWTIPDRTTDRQAIHRVGLTHICRGLEAQLAKCGTPVAAAKPEALATKSSPEKSSLSPEKPAQESSGKKSAEKITASWRDTLPASLQSDDPAGNVAYAIEVLNEDGRGAGLSNQVRVPTIRTLPPPKDFAFKVTSHGVDLTWSSVIPTSYLSVQAERSQAVAGVNYGYRVYRRQEGSEESVLVANVSAGGAPAITLTDSKLEWEKTYYYRAETVTVIAQPGKPELPVEGADTPELKVFADDVFPPAIPSGLQAVFSGPGQQPFVDLIWAPVTDMDLNGYNVYRRDEGSAAVKVNQLLIKTPAYRDANVAPGKTYFYSVSAVDVRGNESARSEEASERVP